jgi:predicted Rossmann fold flavoprotein
VFAAGGSTPVVVIERTADGGRKILISGGGRCNVLPSVLAPNRFVTDSPAPLMRRMLRAWPLAAQRRFFEDEVGVPLALEEETGKLFPRSNRARDVRDGLVALARGRGVEFRFGTAVSDVTSSAEGWRVETSSGPLDASRVIIATGGLSVPKTGSDGTGLAIAARLGHPVHETYPALTPLTALGTPHSALSLPGLSLPVRLRGKWRAATVETAGGFLFTHRGYSGPAVLDISHIAVCGGIREEAPIRVAWSSLSAEDWERELMSHDRLVVAVVSQEMPERLAAALVADAGIPDARRTSSLRRPERVALIERLTAYVLPWTGHEGYAKAEVTGGGVALDAVDPATLESRRFPGLHFCGEVLDAFGPIGGHNFAWAWSTGRSAGLGTRRARPSGAPTCTK